jgi:hypothetical protein
MTRVKDAVKAGGNDSSESFRELLGGFVGEAGKYDLLELSGLSGDSFGNKWVSVPVKVYPPGGYCIDQAAAVGGV